MLDTKNGDFKVLRYKTPLQQGVFLRRYKRFFAEVETADKGVLTLHCPNTGAMRNCMVEGSDCWYSLSDNPRRKLSGTLEQVTTSSGNLAGINSALANTIVFEALQDDRIGQLTNYRTIAREVKFGVENSKVDFLLNGENQNCFVEVKSVSFDMGNHFALFPDARTSRGRKHLRELAHVAALGHRAVLFFCVQISSVTSMGFAKQIDPDYVTALKAAMKDGVEILAMRCNLTKYGITLTRAVDLLI